MKTTDRPLDWGNLLFLVLSPVLAIICGVLYTWKQGFHAEQLALFLIMYVATGISITGGYHRLFAHASYTSNVFMRLFYLIFGACAMQNSALHWAADHRLHHRFTDTDKDPYNAKRGFWWSHMAWVFYKSPADRDFSIVNDLKRDRWVAWQHANNVKIALVVGFGIPFLIGIPFGCPFGMMLWGGLIRVVFVHHATFLINSAAHVWGRQPFSRSDSSRDSTWLAFFTYGEGFHNFHHRFPSDYRNGVRWYQWDPTKWLVAGLASIKATSDLHRVPDHLILRARMEVEALDAEKHLQSMPDHVGHPIRERMASARLQLEKALHQWGESMAHYRDAKKNKWPNRAEVLQACRVKINNYESHLTEARQTWRIALEHLYGHSITGLNS